MADLIVSNVKVDPEAKAGAAVGKIIAEVRNRGDAEAGATNLQLSCMPSSCPNAKDCDALCSAINALIPVAALKPGEAARAEWAAPSGLAWPQGSFTIVAEVDYNNAVAESDEANNRARMTLAASTVSPVAPQPAAAESAPAADKAKPAA
jgi:hypothetical protein